MVDFGRDEKFRKFCKWVIFKENYQLAVEKNLILAG